MDDLKKAAREIRKDIIKMINLAGSGHPGGSLSCVEIVAALYLRALRHDPTNPEWRERDRFVMSKGHAAPTIYSLLSRAGYFPREWLWKLRQCNAKLQGHPDSKNIPGIEASTGSLGQGLSIANGMAIAGKLDKLDYNVYVLLGDGEIQEGQIWEASMTASKHKLDNICAILDHNKLQIDDTIEEIKNPYPLAEKWQAFGWEVIEVNGHDFDELLKAYEHFKGVKGKPTMIIADTVKGKGVSFMENALEWHGKDPNDEQTKAAIEEIDQG
jgi:transketolase